MAAHGLRVRDGYLRVKPVRLHKVGSLYVPERDSERVFELLEPIRGHRYVLTRLCVPRPLGDGTYLVAPSVVICLLPEPW